MQNENETDILGGGGAEPLTGNRQPETGNKKTNPSFMIIILLVLTAAGVYFGPQYRDFLDARETVVGYMIAVRDLDSQGLKELSSKTGILEMEKAGGFSKANLEMLKTFHPPGGRITGIKVTGKNALASLASDAEGFKNAEGRVKLVKEEGEWKIEKVNWKMRLTAGAYNTANALKLRSFIPAPPIKKIPVELYEESEFFMPDYGIEYKVTAQKPLMDHEFTEFENPVISFSPGGQYMLAAGYGNYTVKLIDTSAWGTLREFKMGNRPVSIAAFRDDFLISDAYGGYTKVKAFSFAGEPEKIQVDGSIQPKIYAAQNSKYLASVSYGKKFAVYDEKNLREASRNTLFMPGLNCGAFWPAGPYFFAGTNSRWFFIWDLAAGRGRSYRVSKVTQSVITAISFSPDGKYFVTTHNDSSIVLFETETQKELRNFYVRDKGAMSSAFSPDGKFFVTGHDKGWVYFWSMPEARQIAAFQLHDDMILSVIFMPGKAKMATAGNDHKIRVWDLM